MNFKSIKISGLPGAPSREAVMRRLGAAPDSGISGFRDRWYGEALEHCDFNGVWRLFRSAELTGEGIGFGGGLVTRILDGCEWGVLMAVTAGPGITAWVGEIFASGDAARGTFCDAVAGEGVEEALSSLHRSLVSTLSRQGISLKRARISPGYGDFSLSCQPTVIRELNAGELLGIRVNKVNFMTPEKSATALTGGFEIAR